MEASCYSAHLCFILDYRYILDKNYKKKFKMMYERERERERERGKNKCNNGLIVGCFPVYYLH